VELQLQDLSEPIFYVNGGTSRNLAILTTLGFESNSTYNIRCRPIFTNGVEGTWGPMSCLMTGSAGLVASPSNDLQLAINEREVAEVEVFPNPVSDQFVNFITVGFDQDMLGTIEIIDGFGRLVYSQNSLIQNDVINELEVPANWTNGMYFIRVVTNDKVVTRKFMIQR
jgi:Secretion system C-terminal sorting domain